MGNCLVSNKVIARDHEDEISQSKLEPAIRVHGGKNKNEKMKKSVSFKLKDNVDEVVRDNRPHIGESSKSGVLRVRVLVTKEELKQILKNTQDRKFSSVEQLLSASKLRNRSISEVRIGDRGFDGNNRRLHLESIPEGR
ncbi:hypothetical protein ACJRO7_001679 [Eucalyptus globulus]|uniref:Uncharacterized protein n=1 Tax=Eucalyptus globulus TaxID=34317 RepID=A0ABD3LRS2_EUCGL